MSKIYDAILKARKEQLVTRQGTEALQETPSLEERSKITPKKAKRVAPFPRKRGRRITVEQFIAKSDSVMAEQFRKMRSSLTTHNLVSSLGSVLVTSCMPGEGKTKVAINLSASIAKGLDEFVILIDADLRRKTLSSQLGLVNTVGLSDVLQGKAAIRETFVGTEIERLAVVPAGFNAPNPAELIASVRMKDLVRQLRERYRDSYIFIDSTPIVSTSEASILSQMVDGVIVVILADETRRDLVRRELKTIDYEKILGVVLNCAEFETADYYHKYYKGYGITETG